MQTLHLKRGQLSNLYKELDGMENKSFKQTLILALGRQKQVDFYEVQGQAGLHSNFQASQD